MAGEVKFTKGPWTVCWQTYNGRRTNFHITASPYGSVRPLARTDWKFEWSEVEGDELVANGHLMGACPDMYTALLAAARELDTAADRLGYLGDLDHADDCKLRRQAIEEVLAKAEGRS